jgi:hypothetical protein
MCFLTEMRTLDEAESRVMAYLETENFLDYSIPADEKGWQLIAVDFHY